MDIGKEYEVKVEDMSPNGEGVARIKGFPIFIKNAQVGEHVKIKITNLANGCAEAEKAM